MLNKALALLVLVPLLVPKLVPEWGSAMAGKLRYWKEKDGRFWARIAVPVRLRPFLDNPRGELLEPLGGERRAALRLHPAAVARLQLQIATAAQRANPAPLKHASHRTAITTADFGRAVWQRYLTALEADDVNREIYPSKAEIAAELAKLEQRAKAGEIGAAPLALLEASLDFLRLKDARATDQFTRAARLTALERELGDGDTHQIEHEMEAFLAMRGLSAEAGTPERAVLAKHMMRAEIEALQRTIERDRCDYRGQPTDTVVKAPAGGVEAIKHVGISALWSDYVNSRVIAGFMKDGGIRQRPVIKNLLKFLGHNDARQITRRNLLDWRDKLLKTLSAKTTNDIYLSTVRSMLKWAHEEERLLENLAATVRQSKPKKQRVRDPGFSNSEARLS